VGKWDKEWFFIMMVYLAGAIDMVSSEQREGWRDAASKMLKSDGISTYNPAAAFVVDLGANVAPAIVEINEIALQKCDFALFNMSSSQPSIGTPIELFIAAKLNKSRVVVWDNKHDPVPAYLAYYGGMIVYTLTDALAVIRAHKADQVQLPSPKHL